MPVYQLDPNPHRIAYGTSIGILQSNARIPMIPGDVGNASTYKFPVVYRVVEEVTTERLIFKADPTLAGPIIQAAQALERAGVAGITADCGFMSLFQEQVAAAVNIPIFLSSWLQVPFIRQILPPHQKIGALVGNSRYITRQVLAGAGIDESTPLVIAGMEDQPAFRSAVILENGVLDSESVEQEAVSMAKQLKQDHPDIGAIFLECSDLPPYAAAIQEAVRLPVFDFTTLINFIYAALVRSRFDGTYY